MLPTSKYSYVNVSEISNYESEKCLVCYDSIKKLDRVVVHDKIHPFHETCIIPWIKNSSTCPTCRTKVDASPILEGTDKHAYKVNQLSEGLNEMITVQNVTAVGIVALGLFCSFYAPEITDMAIALTPIAFIGAIGGLIYLGEKLSPGFLEGFANPNVGD